MSDLNIHSSGFKRYFANTSWLMGYRVLSMLAALFVGIYVARYLGPEQFGLLSYAVSFVGLFTAIATLGIDSILIRNLLKTPEKSPTLLGTACWLKIFGAFVMWFCIFLTIPYMRNDQQTNIMIAFIGFAVIFQALNVIDFYFQAQVKSKYVVLIQVSQLTISSIIKIVFVIISAPLEWFAGVYLLDGVVLAAGLFGLYSVLKGNIKDWKWDYAVAKEMLIDSWPLILSGIAISVYLKIGQVMIKEMLDAKQVGLYAAAARLSEAWYFIPVAVASSVFPAIINAKLNNEDLYYQRLQGLYYLMVIIALLIALPVTFFSTWIISILYGDIFLPAASVLSIHIWTGVFVFMGVASGKWLLAENYMNKNLYRTILGMAVSIVANLMLIPRYGIYGAAVSALMAQASADFLYDIFDKETYPSLKMKIRALNPFLLCRFAFENLSNFTKKST